MSTISDYYKYAELSWASYVDLSSGMAPQDYIDALMHEDDGMSLTQAQTFASHWRVIDQLPNTAEGFSATVFQSVDDNSYVLSIRGTETSTIKDGLIDWSTNFGDIGADGIAIAQAIDLFNYYQRLTVRQGEDLVQYAYSHEEEGKQRGQIYLLILQLPCSDRFSHPTNWMNFLETTDGEQDLRIQKRTKTGRPLGGEPFVKHLEKITGRALMLKTAGRPRIDK
ncbi:hypothetical protein SAMN05660420_03395 [Desulfuromusa kysingii]|uniref:Uncharacterized protein n=1 Tax=Desulfuromusa kysingii TaxID=37625 RepID=A0A1H4EI21_9BACT|nr:hypothetical protein [Desulfuromusa kysingii]SEA84724.1 hypothetical protein SAMN05660420_03395 [Desulfuromusa kysingii]